VMGGSGEDSIQLQHYSREDWDNNEDHIQSHVQGFENISFKEGDGIGDDSVFQSYSETTFEVPLSLSAELADTDGSESLSDITLSGLPDGASLSAGVDNGDGSWSLTQDDLPELNVQVSAGSENFDIQVSVTSTESSTGETTDVTVSQSVVVPNTIDGETQQGDSGDNELEGSYDNDLMLGEAGDDELSGGAGNDLLQGGAGNDEIQGGDGQDHLYGGAGNDQLEGGAGDDFAFGGAGNDVYEMNAFDGSDYFSGGEGGGWTDVIDLSGVVANDPGNPWTIEIDGTQVEYDIAASALELNPDTAGVVILGDGSELNFEGVDRIEW